MADGRRFEDWYMETTARVSELVSTLMEKSEENLSEELADIIRAKSDEVMVLKE
jgi:hypothetical protein